MSKYAYGVLLCVVALLLPPTYTHGRVIDSTVIVSNQTNVKDMTVPNHKAIIVKVNEPIVEHYLRHTSRKQRSQRTRKGQVVGDGVRDFKPLTCNSQILSPSYVCTRTWSSMFGTTSTHTNRIVIPCGVCIVMNHASGTLDLKNGIDIQGKLVIPDGIQQLYVTLPSMIVQGELSITSTKPVNGIPNIKFTMVGTDNTLTFTPIDVNANACKGQATCTAGKKSIVVAGGKITLNGLPNSTPTWTRLYDAHGASFNNPDTIVVPSSTVNKWDIGSQIVITSHTHKWMDNQVRTITQRVNAGLVGYTGFKLNATFIRPTTIIESKDFAVEVALLSRNILFQGARDDTAQPLHGGHFIIFNTPTIVQRITGVEFTFFGQQGQLGRYPIHFHHCGDVSGSIVSKNSIRQSTQRCVDIHGTNKVKIQENVAFDTKGHCYITEDGIETGNEFIMNIGIQTGPVTRLIPSIASANNGLESDDEPATFWITNPSNTWIGNVAAGSQNSGYWFDPKLRGTRAYLYSIRYRADTVLLTSFKDNVVHSVGVIKDATNSMNSYAFRMYTPGYLPNKTATFDGLKSYRNSIGINIHACHKIHLTNSLFADNWQGIQLERSEDIRVSNTIVIGESASYRSLMARQAVPKVCLRQKIYGLRLGTWQNKDGPGYTLSNVTFSGFNNEPCLKSNTIIFDDPTLKQGIFETMSTFDRTKLPDGPPLVDMCIVTSTEYDMLYINDLNGNFRPSSMTTVSNAPATLIASDNNELLKFVNTVKCASVPLGCYSYCRDTCFRTMRVEVTGSQQATWKLKVCVRGVVPAKCVYYKAGRRGSSGPHTIMAHMSVGQLYDAVVVNSSGQPVVPTSQVAFYEDNHCGTTQFGVALVGQTSTIPYVPWN